MIKQEACLNLINYVKSSDDLKVINNANKILDSIKNAEYSLFLHIGPIYYFWGRKNQHQLI